MNLWMRSSLDYTYLCLTIEAKFVFSKQATKNDKVFTVDYDTYYILSN